MTAQPRRPMVFAVRLMIAVLVLLVIVTAYGVSVLSSSARQEIDGLATANSDAVQWSLAQAEVELLVFTNLLSKAQISGESADLATLRARFDVFYSRVRTVETAPVFARLRELPEAKLGLSVVDRYLKEAVPLIDGTDAELRAALPLLATRADQLRLEMRTISLAGVRVFSRMSEAQRDRVADALRDLAVLTFLLFALLLVMLMALGVSLTRDRKKTEAIRMSKDRLRSVIGAALDGIMVVDRNGRIIEYNPAAERIFGYSQAEAVGHDMATLIVPEHMRAAHLAGMERHRRTGEMRVLNRGLVQMVATSKDERIFPVELSIATAESEIGPLYVAFIRDISSRIEAEQELVAARDRALAGEKAKAEMLAVMSHEMRTPLNGVVGSLQLLADTSLNTKQRRFIEVMKTSSQMLLDRVNTVLDISRADSGHLSLAQTVFDPLAVLRDLISSLEIQAEARGNRLRVAQVGQDLGFCRGDPSRLQQILVNLIGNAIKFTENGTIAVELERDAGSDEIEFRVSDTGIGIAEADCDRIFADFVTLDPSYGRKVEGTGLGLGIARRLVIAMGGTIGVESERGEGSVFWMRLPLPEVHTAPTGLSTRQKPNARLNLSVLLIEDNEINRLVAREMLAALGCVTAEAVDGEEGVALAATRRFDVILMDISMPRLDGTEATRRIRAEAGPNSRTPIIALTAHALPDDITRFHAAGMSEVLLKPISRDRLQEVLSSPVATTSQAGPSVADELIATLGAEKARTVTAAAGTELAADLALLLLPDGFSDLPAVAARTHRMAGLAAVVGFSDMAAHLRQAETAARKGEAGPSRTALDAAGVALTNQMASASDR